jgi:hypothetical protein
MEHFCGIGERRFIAGLIVIVVVPQGLADKILYCQLKSVMDVDRHVLDNVIDADPR